MILLNIRGASFFFCVAIAGALIAKPQQLNAQQSLCTPTLQCAQLAVDAAARAEAAVKFLEQRISAQFDAFEKALGGGRILAIAEVKSGRLVSSSDGVTFDLASGMISFPNPKRIKFVPVVSDFVERHYVTQMHWVRGIHGTDKFSVWQTALDTGDRNSPPSDFTAVVIGFETKP